jgi:hypothetical protein
MAEGFGDMSKDYRFAEKTKVTVEKSQESIRTLLVTRMKADQFMIGFNQGREMVAFRLMGIPHEIKIPIAKNEQERRRFWRCILLHVKSMWESIQNGIIDKERAFLQYILLPNNQTVGEYLPGQIKSALSTGRMPQIMPALSEGDKK